MKELSIEQKAQRYDEAIAHAKKLLKTIGNATLGNLVLKNEFERMFPELAESEDDRVRKELIRAFKSFNTIKVWNGIERIKILAWLEKQGEQNLADKIESKFKVGDWIVYKDNVWKVCNISLKAYYELLNINNEVIIRHFEGVDKTAHLWTLQDAKDGDVLASKDGDDILIFRNLDGNKSFSSYYNIRRKKEIGWHNGWCYGSFIPATKEQCDALMKVMTEAGYTFDFEKKELKKIEQNLTVTDEELAQAKCFAYNDALGKIEWRNGEPTFDDGWSAAIDYIRKKSLKYEHTWKPSEGQLECLGYAIEKAEKDWSPLINNRIYLTLKALKEELEKL